MGDRLTLMPGNNNNNNNSNHNSAINTTSTAITTVVTTTSNSAAAAAAGAAAAAAGASGAAALPPSQLKCPRCDSTNTKFCYYNNYSLSQPRHFCKACKRYWTRGGTLRNVPVGGGCRKNKRPKKHSSHVVVGAAAAASSVPVTGSVRPGPVPLLPPLSHLDASINSLFFASSSSMNLPLIPNLQSSTAAQIPIDLQPHIEYQIRSSGGDEFSLGQIQQPGLGAEFPLFGHSLLPNSLASLLELNGSAGIIKNEKAVESAATAERVEWLTPCQNSLESMNAALNPIDSPYFYWNSGVGGGGGGSWADAANCGPSIAPLL